MKYSWKGLQVTYQASTFSELKAAERKSKRQQLQSAFSGRNKMRPVELVEGKDYLLTQIEEISGFFRDCFRQNNL